MWRSAGLGPSSQENNVTDCFCVLPLEVQRSVYNNQNRKPSRTYLPIHRTLSKITRPRNHPRSVGAVVTRSPRAMYKREQHQVEILGRELNGEWSVAFASATNFQAIIKSPWSRNEERQHGVFAKLLPCFPSEIRLSPSQKWRKMESGEVLYSSFDIPKYLFYAR